MPKLAPTRSLPFAAIAWEQIDGWDAIPQVERHGFELMLFQRRLAEILSRTAGLA